MNALQEILLLLINTAFSIYAFLLLIRMLLGLVKANFHNPISQFLVKVTDPVIKPLRRFIPSVGKIDTSAIIAVIGCKIVQLTLVSMIGLASLSGDFIPYVIGGTLRLAVWVFIIALIIQVIVSWIGNTTNNPVVPLAQDLTEPLLRPIRKHMPNLGVIDLSVMVAIILLNIALILIKHLFG